MTIWRGQDCKPKEKYSKDEMSLGFQNEDRKRVSSVKGTVLALGQKTQLEIQTFFNQIIRYFFTDFSENFFSGRISYQLRHEVVLDMQKTLRF